MSIFRRSRRPDGPVGSGLVLAVRGRRATVLLPGGSFLRLGVLPGTRPGDQVLVPAWALRGEPSPAQRRSQVLAVASMALAVTMVVTVASYFARPLPAIAAVSVDVNPSFVLWVSSQARVISAHPYDARARAILEAEPPARQPLAEYLALLLAAVELPAGECWLVLGVTPVQPGAALDQALLAKVEAARSKGEAVLRQRAPAVHSATLEVPSEVARAAAGARLSPARYALALAAAAAGVGSIDTETAGGEGLVQAIRAASVEPGAVVRQAKEGELRQLWKEQAERISPRGQTRGRPGDDDDDDDRGRPADDDDDDGRGQGRRTAPGDDPGAVPGDGQGTGREIGRGADPEAGREARPQGDRPDRGERRDRDDPGEDPEEDPEEDSRRGPIRGGGAQEASGRAQEVLERLGEKLRERLGPSRGSRSR